MSRARRELSDEIPSMLKRKSLKEIPKRERIYDIYKYEEIRYLKNHKKVVSISWKNKKHIIEK